MTIKEIVKIHVIRTLEQCKTRNKAIKVLGISMRTLRNYLNEYGLGKQHRAEKHLTDMCERYHKNLTPQQRDYYENLDRIGD